MKPGFFLDIADNTGDAFLYQILPAKAVDDIPLDRDLFIVCNIVRPRTLDCGDAPLIKHVGDHILFVDAELDSDDPRLDGARPPSYTTQQKSS